MKRELFETPFLYVAMDFTGNDEMRYRTDQIAIVQGDWGLKINDDYISTHSPEITANHMKPYGKSLFFDMKLLKGSRRMINIIKELNTIGGIDFTNIFAVVGNDLKKVIDATGNGETGILALTLLTHLGNDECKKIYRRSFPGQVKVLAEIASDAGCPGALIPGTCLKAVKHLNFIKAVTAIRPEWYQSKKANPQKQDVTPQQAIKDGANILIAGSPIWDTPSPTDSLRRILDEMSDAYAKL